MTGLANRQLSHTLAARFKAAGINMTAEQWGAILLLLNGDAQTQGQIGAQLFLEKSSASRLLNGLERRGWINRTRDPKDSRQKLVTPTPRVLETAERCAVIAREVIADAQRGMTREEQSACRSLLSRIIENLNGMGR
ncbi:MarR family winged helix-turn-helix transcriptional regulator [Desulfobacter curvatus]|uniref:MarR family winged helix-turn-helix transcriptional regulator n=1 Tax=Desulfobacter curvatus TaxID=2290 RepID=UPI00036B8C4B|nr:MarR family transcriptional regulator [Desulfobacter curvatus]